jgi:hypothetical protein
MRFMRYRWLFNLLLLIILITSLVILLHPASNKESVELSDDQRTLSSFKMVDDIPLYVMTYYGDYGFDDYLERGLASIELPRLSPTHAWACTTFSASSPDSDALLGRNFDWYDHPALLLFTDPPEAYASVTMVDLHYLGFYKDQEPSTPAMDALLDTPYWAFDGMNEQGLAIGMMAVSQADPPLDPDKVTISSLEAIRLMLDYAKDVDEAIALLDQYNLDFIGGPPLHYLISDRNGNSTIVEFLDGEMILLENEDPWQVSTNFILSTEKPQGSNSSCWRYNQAYQDLRDAEGDISSEEAMKILESVAQPNTLWSIVYDQENGEIDLAVGRDFRHIHQFNLNSPPE